MANEGGGDVGSNEVAPGRGIASPYFFSLCTNGEAWEAKPPGGTKFRQATLPRENFILPIHRDDKVVPGEIVDFPHT